MARISVFMARRSVRYAHLIVKTKRTPMPCKMHRMSEVKPDYAVRLTLARRKAGFKTAKAAALFHGWNKETYPQHENGTRGITRMAKRYAKAFKVSEAWLLTGTGPGPDEDAEALAFLHAVYKELLPDDRRAMIDDAEMRRLAAEAKRLRAQARKDQTGPASGRQP